MLSKDVVEVRRKTIYRHLQYGHVEMPKEDEEIITIDRSKVNRRPTDIVLESINTLGFKSKLTRLYSYGYMLKRQAINPVSHNAFKDDRALRLIRDVFMYKNMKECN